MVMVALSFVAVVLVIALIFFSGPPSRMHRIVLTEDGFKPDTLTIAKGDTIEFSTERGTFFWPASDLHPTHLIYPEFDPKDAIPKDKTWSFRFEKTGSWKFHDHLAPYFTGTIIVEGGIR